MVLLQVLFRRIRLCFTIHYEILPLFSRVGGSLIVIDGTKIRAQNSKHNCITQSGLDKKIEYAEAQINAYLMAIAKDEVPADDLTDKLKTYQELKEQYLTQKQELKDEYKNSEGDPQIKGKIKARMREASQKRMMQELPNADVVITNPTHLAVALKYDRDSASAPVVIAKGADYLAERIKSVARENQIEIVENKPVARMLYYNVELEQEIPSELYQAVAEILAYVYGLKNQT